MAFLLRLVDGFSQRQHQAFPRHLQHVEARLALGRLQIRARRTPKLDDLKFGVDEHAGRREVIDQHAVGFALRVQFDAQRVVLSNLRQNFRPPARRRLGGALEGNRQLQGRRRACLSQEDLLLFIGRLKQVGKFAN